jgi:hypothetical protein
MVPGTTGSRSHNCSHKIKERSETENLYCWVEFFLLNNRKRKNVIKHPTYNRNSFPPCHLLLLLSFGFCLWTLLLVNHTREPVLTRSPLLLRRMWLTFEMPSWRNSFDKQKSSLLTGIASSQLLVYRNKISFDKRNAATNDGKEEPVDPTESIGLLGSKEEIIVVVVPSSRSSSQSTSESSLTGKEANPKRKQQWIELNKILEENAKKSKTNDSTA